MIGHVLIASVVLISQAVEEPKPPAPAPAGAAHYHTLSGRDAQVIFSSDAPLEKVVGKSNAVVGYAISGPKAEPARLVNAAWVLPVKSLATGIPLRDEHMVGKEWLDGDAYPNIEFTLTRVEEVRKIKDGDGFSTWSATLVGNMSIHGVTKQITVPNARLSFFDESAKTKSIAPGNLLFLKCDYSVKLSDFGVSNPDIPGKVSDTVTLSQMLRMSTVPPTAAPR